MMSWKSTGGKCTLCHFGSVMVCQTRNAFRRQSSSHSGSPFLAEMMRMMSSFSPGGTASASMSVTNPYL